MWREAITPEVGVNQHTMKEGNNNVITLQGNSRAYTLDRLKREALLSTVECVRTRCLDKEAAEQWASPCGL